MPHPNLHCLLASICVLLMSRALDKREYLEIIFVNFAKNIFFDLSSES